MVQPVISSWLVYTATDNYRMCVAFCLAVAITPTTFLLPPLLWVMYKRPAKWSVDWAVNWGLVCFTGALGVMGFIASVYIIIIGWVSDCG